MHSVGGRHQHLDGVAAQEPVPLLALGDLDDDALTGQRVPHEDDNPFVAGDHGAAVRHPFGVHGVPLAHQ
jgi:hypothetical protein